MGLLEQVEEADTGSIAETVTLLLKPLQTGFLSLCHWIINIEIKYIAFFKQMFCGVSSVGVLREIKLDKSFIWKKLFGVLLKA